MSWKDFFYGTGGVFGDFAYGTTHLLSIAILIVVTVVLCIVCKKTNSKVTRIILISVACFQILFEIGWRVFYIAKGGGDASFVSIWPFYPCNLAGIIVPIAALTKSKILKKMFYAFAFVGAIITFAIPDGIFGNQYLTFPILKSILQHCAIIIIPVIEYVTGTFRPKLKDFGWFVLGFAVHVINSELIKLIANAPGDYIFFRSTLPFVIPGVPQFITLIVFGAIVMFLLHMALDPKGTKKLFTSKKQKQLPKNQ